MCRIASVASVALLLIAVPCCRQDEGSAHKGEGPGRSGRLPNIIFLTVDTLRADHMALYGYARDTMPAIEAFAETAVVFDNAVVPRGSTRPSYASMLTGLYPFRHGVRSNERVLHENIRTLQEWLKSAGYHTAAFIGNFVMVSELSGMAQGFDVYDDQLEERAAYERTAFNTLRAILKWLDGDPPQPFFLFTNFMDPHAPYSPPERFQRLYRDSRMRVLKHEQINPYLYVPGQLNFYDYVDRYDAEIRYTDEALGRLIEELKRRRVWDDSVVVFVADHGESLGEHGVFFEHHYHVWEETVRVPLAIRLPRSTATQTSARPKRIRSLCSPMDLTPTILGFLGLDCDVKFDGRSLLPMMNGVEDEARTLLLEFPDVATWSESLPDIYAMRTATNKLIQVFDPNTGAVMQSAVFDLTADPLEQHHIPFDGHDPTHHMLRQALDSKLAQVRNYTLPFAVTVYEVPFPEQRKIVEHKRREKGIIVKTLTKQEVEKLRGLGYVQ